MIAPPKLRSGVGYLKLDNDYIQVTSVRVWRKNKKKFLKWNLMESIYDTLRLHLRRAKKKPVNTNLSRVSQTERDCRWIHL